MRFAKWILLTATLAVTWGQTPDWMSLSGTWEFALGSDPAGLERLSHFSETNFQPTGFRPIPVPSNWSLQGFEGILYSRMRQAGEGFYLYSFKAPESFKGKRVLLHFDGVWSSAEVWLNSQSLGRHDSGFTGFAFDVSRALKPGAENRLAVRVRQITKDSDFDTNDDWSLGGIYRNVWLESMPAGGFIDHVETATTFDDQFREADLKIRTLVAGGQAGPYELRAILAGPDGKEVQRASLAVPAHRGTARDTLMTLHLAEPLHWTAETPNLYRLNVEMVNNGAVAHSRTSRVGFRQVSTAGGVLRINGQVVKIRGVCRHDENPDVGRATRPEQWLEDLKLMKAANINTVRTSHYPPAEGFIELADELGMYIIDEVPMGFGGELGDDPSFMASGLLRAQETIARDRNHPSVIIWSIGNEDPLTAMHMAVIRAVKGADPTRPLLMPWRADAHLPPEIDILAPHYRTPSGYDALAATSTRPVLTTEYTHAFAEEGFGGLEECWRALTRHPSGAGGAIWMWQDQGLYQTRTNANGQQEKYMHLVVDGIDGIVGADRKPQRDYWETRAVYAPILIPVDSIAFWPKQASVRVPIRNDFDFTELSTVAVRWSLMAGEKELAKGEGRVNAVPHATGYFVQPIDAIKSVEPGVAHYVHYSFLRPDNSEIVERSVELVANGPAAQAPAGPAQIRVRQGKTVVVSAGTASYEFDPATATLVSASVGAAKVVTGSKFTIWRPLGQNDTILPLRIRPADIVDLNKYTTTVKSWKVAESPSGVRIDAEAEHKANDRNSFTVSYTYEIGRDGVLRVRYEVQPKIEFPWLPEIGMEFQTAAGVDNLRWLGLGPLDAYPNEHTAPIFGQYAGRVGSDATKGNKSIRWAELATEQGVGLRVADCSYIRVDGRTLRVLPSVVGRSEKNRRPEAPEYRLDLTPTSVFQGGFSLSLLGPEKK
jgi:beta-galactosidase